MNCSVNPHFGYNYPLFRIALQIEFGITCLFTFVGAFMIVYYSPPQKSKIFRFMIAKEMIIALLFTMSIGVLATPITYLPYPAAEFIGTFRDFDVPTIAILAIDLHLLFMIGASFAPLFYYRMTALLSEDHFLNNRIFKYFYYTIFYFVTDILPAPYFLLMTSWQPDDTLKQRYFEIIRVCCDALFTDNVYLIGTSFRNIWLLLGFLFAVFCLIFSPSMVVISCYKIIYILKTSRRISKHRKRQHAMVLISLISLAAIMLIEYVFVLPLCLVQIMVKSQRVDMFNRLIMVGNALIPTGIFTYGATYTPYRRAIFNMIPCLDHFVGYIELAIQRATQRRESKVAPIEAVLKI